MTSTTEWSAEFDILWNNIMSNQAPGLNPYEKSVFLTRGEELTVIGIYNGTISVPFESTEEVTDYLSPLVVQAECQALDPSAQQYHIISGSDVHDVVYQLPEDLLFRTYESCKLNLGDCGERDTIIVPVTQDEFWRTYRNPFKGPNKRRVLRLSYAEVVESSGELDYHQVYSELVSKYPIASYSVRYIRKPDPIILEDIPEGYPSINGQRTAATCKLHENLHQTILINAVNAAKAVWASS